jgi:hypothetical protein
VSGEGRSSVGVFWTKSQETGSVPHVVEFLLSKHETLSSNSSTTKKKTKNKGPMALYYGMRPPGEVVSTLTTETFKRRPAPGSCEKEVWYEIWVQTLTLPSPSHVARM